MAQRGVREEPRRRVLLPRLRLVRPRREVLAARERSLMPEDLSRRTVFRELSPVKQRLCMRLVQ